MSFCSRFRGAPIIPVAARPGGPDAPETEAPQGIPELIEVYRQLDPHRGLRLTPGGPSEGTLHTDPSVPPPSPSSRSSIRAELQASSGQPRPCRAVHVLVSLLFLSPSNSSTRQLPPDWGSGAASPIPAPRAVPAPPAGPSQAGPAWLPSSSLPPGLGITDRGGAQPLGGPGAPSGQGESGVPLLSPRAAQRLRG